MDTLRLVVPGVIELIETDEPRSPESGEVVVRVCHVGLCGTDIHAYAGRQPFFTYPRILGHELGVVVEEVGSDVSGLAVGDRCAVEPYLAEPGDRAYEKGKTNCSASTQCLGVHVDGGMRERIVLPAKLLHLSQKLDTRSLALVETLGIGCHAVERARLEEGESVVVVGAGPIGLTVVQFAVLSGVRVTVMDMSEDRLESCKSLFPSVETLKIGVDEDAKRGFRVRPDCVFDCTGNQQSMERSIALPAHGGRVVLVGICREMICFNDPDFHTRELSIIGSRNSTAKDFKFIIDKMETGEIDPSSWITHECRSGEFSGVIDTWLKPDSGLLKGMISFV
tara:strand:+ start:456 stop:1466 length:1011 start_codon:yes stop_codon:yes gene_type:complete